MAKKTAKKTAKSVKAGKKATTTKKPELLFEVVHGLSSGLTAACEAEYDPDYEPKKGYRPMRDVKLSQIWEGMEEAYGILIEEYGEDVTLHELAHAKAE